MAERGLVLAKPLTFMNASGRRWSACCSSTRSTPPDLLVVVDDVNLELGRLRARPGSAGGTTG
jgi:peptidyl-tRNA hydrolase, PTH1 family